MSELNNILDTYDPNTLEYQIASDILYKRYSDYKDQLEHYNKLDDVNKLLFLVLLSTYYDNSKLFSTKDLTKLCSDRSNMKPTPRHSFRFGGYDIKN
ncbi:MAG: hypothetical protein GY738_30810 [Pseudoalteromonas sp.]|nr:hypothetical protein [Pseudoalteromonas sp.]